MSNNYTLLKKDGSDAISGFYYDEQLRNRGMTMTLHPNMRYTDKPPNYWEQFSGSEVFQEEGADYKYSLTPIATAIVTEDFQIGVASDWMDSTLTDEATSLFNQLKPYAAIASKISPVFKKAQEEGEKVVGTSGSKTGDDWQEKANKIPGWLGKAGDIATQYLNRAVVVQGSRFSVYNGTSVAFGNMSMKFTLFSDWVNGRWKSCITRVNELVPYVIGKYTTLDSNTGKLSKSEWNKFIGWQIPPGGFKADLENVDNIQQGTLKLVIGSWYAINNLVIVDAQFTFSKQLVKEPNSKNKIKLWPMYCDVLLNLKPASKYTGESFRKAISGEDCIGSIKRDYETEINTRLDTVDTALNPQVLGGLNTTQVKEIERNIMSGIS